jgi:hypothetical protein
MSLNHKPKGPVRRRSSPGAKGAGRRERMGGITLILAVALCVSLFAPASTRSIPAESFRALRDEVGPRAAPPWTLFELSSPETMRDDADSLVPNMPKGALGGMCVMLVFAASSSTSCGQSS